MWPLRSCWKRCSCIVKDLQFFALRLFANSFVFVADAARAFELLAERFREGTFAYEIKGGRLSGVKVDCM